MLFGIPFINMVRISNKKDPFCPRYEKTFQNVSIILSFKFDFFNEREANNSKGIFKLINKKTADNAVVKNEKRRKTNSNKQNTT